MKHKAFCFERVAFSFIAHRHDSLVRFRQAIYNVSDARKDANAMLRIIETGGELDSTKYLFKNLYARYIRQKQAKAELLQKGISDEVIESALAHKTDNEIKYAYEREKASLGQLRILMQWYGDYLHSLCEFEI